MTIAEVIEPWIDDPCRFVREVFGVELDGWQVDALDALRTEPRIGLAACKGPGKSAFLAWAGWWILCTHIDAQGVALSITADNLKVNLWKELATWYAKAPILQASFTTKAEKIESKTRPLTWFLVARSFAADSDATQQANAIAGLHGPCPFFLLDEVGDMAAGVIGAAKGIFSVSGQHGWVLAAGNRTCQSGAMYYIDHTDRARWKVITITGDPDDPKRSSRIDIENARAEIEAHGRDDPWVMVNILGLYPPVGQSQLMGDNEVEAAMSRDLPALAKLSDAIIWGLDPARSDRSGADEAALARRQGILCRPILTWRGLDGAQLADAVGSLLLRAEKEGGFPDALFVDVGGVGASAYDFLRRLGWDDLVFPIDFGGSASDKARYYDKRTEMWVELAEWVSKFPSCIPDDRVLRAELTAPRCGHRRVAGHTTFKLESKDEMKARGVKSPNRADALCLTFARPVAPKARAERERLAVGSARNRVDYDPLGEVA